MPLQCVPSLEDLAAAEALADLTGEQSPEEFVQQQCEAEQALTETRLCRSL